MASARWRASSSAACSRPASHPDADRLSVCIVDTGDEKPSQIVCGAPNVAAGQTVAVATPGAVMPDGTTLKTAKLRGIESQRDDPGRGRARDRRPTRRDHGARRRRAGAGHAAGRRAADRRPTCSSSRSPRTGPTASASTGSRARSMRRPGRRCAAAVGGRPRERGRGRAASRSASSAPICARGSRRACSRTSRSARRPLWLKARLMAAGQRPISNVVDITNYVMLLTGQPLHAFDLDRVAGAALTVRRAKPGEQVQTLDGQTRTLDEQMVLIADARRADLDRRDHGRRALARSGRTRPACCSRSRTGTARTSIARRCRLGLRSEASTRFEKGFSPSRRCEAQAVATKLMIELCGARVAPGTIDVGGPGPPPSTIRLRDARVDGLLGIEIPRARCRGDPAGARVQGRPAIDGLDVTVAALPPRRRHAGGRSDRGGRPARRRSRRCPRRCPSRHGASGRLTPRQRLRRRARTRSPPRVSTRSLGWSFAESRPGAQLRLPEQTHGRAREPDVQRAVAAANDV